MKHDTSPLTSTSTSSNTTADSAHTHLSAFHKMLIYIEDRERVRLPDLSQFASKRQMLGALGRLEGLHYIERIQLNDEDFFILTEKGDTVLATIIANLPTKPPEWDGKWRMILFDIPESQRTIRQMVRLKLIDLGVRMLQSSVWITPYEEVAAHFRQFISNETWNKRVHIFESRQRDANPINVAQLWNLSSLEYEYKALFTYLNKTYKSLEKSPVPSYDAKCLIVQLALVAKKDPHLPQDLMPPRWIGYEAQNWYQKLRIYCK